MNKLIKSAQLGDTLALETLIRQLEPIRKSICAQYSTLDPQDLDQELIILMIESLADYDPEKATFPWYIRQKSRYYALDLAKKHTARTRMTQRPTEGQDPLENLTTDETPEENYENKERNKRLQAALEKLKPLEREIIIEYYYRRKNLKEIAQAQKRSISTISKHKTQALKKLRRFLG